MELGCLDGVRESFAFSEEVLEHMWLDEKVKILRTMEPGQAEQNMVWNKRKIHELGLAEKLNFLSMHQAEKLEQPCQIQMSTSYNSLRSLQFLARQKLAESLEMIFLAKAVNTNKQTAFPKHCHVPNLRREPELLNIITASPPSPPSPTNCEFSQTVEPAFANRLIESCTLLTGATMEDMAKVYSKQEEPMDLDREEMTDMTINSQVTIQEQGQGKSKLLIHPVLGTCSHPTQAKDMVVVEVRKQVTNVQRIQKPIMATGHDGWPGMTG